VKKHKLLRRAGRYALIEMQTGLPEYVVCCSYCDKTGTWGAGFYFAELNEAIADYNERVSWCCCDCENRNVKEHPTWCMK